MCCKDGRKILPERALELTQGVLDALSYSHKAGIMHRDIKPANVMLTQTGGVKVMDFGIARAVADTSATMTQTAAVIGTAQYLSPEQARGETVDARSDLYSAGCLLYELLVGRPPFIGDSPVSVAYQHVREAPDATQPAGSGARSRNRRRHIEGAGQGSCRSLPIRARDEGRHLAPPLRPADRAQQATAVVPVGVATVAANAYDDPTRVAGPPPVAPPGGPEEEYEEEEPQKSRVGLAILIGALIVLALGLGGYALYRMLSPDTVQTVAVPNVVGYTEAQATEQLTGRNLQVEVTKVNGDEESKGTVTEQNPAADAVVQVNSTVTITLNEGPKTGTIPKGLVGQDRKDVEAALDDAKFTNVTSKAAKSEDANTKPGEVLSISPKEGETVPLDTKVTIRYATGKSEVPDFDGLSRSAAIREANNKGFGDPVFVEKQTSNGTPGTVIAQNPQAGANVDRDTTIRLTLAVQPPPPPTTPPPTTEPPPTKPPTTKPPATPTQTPTKEKTPSDSNT